MRVTTQQLATYIVRDGARLAMPSEHGQSLPADRHVYRVPLRGGHMDVVVTSQQRDEVWRLIEEDTHR